MARQELDPEFQFKAIRSWPGKNTDPVLPDFAHKKPISRLVSSFSSLHKPIDTPPAELSPAIASWPVVGGTKSLTPS